MCFLAFFLSLLNVVRREVLLEVEVGHNNIRWGSEKIAELIVKNDRAVLGMLKTLLNDVGVHELGYLGAGDEPPSGSERNSRNLGVISCFRLKPLFCGASLSLLAGRIILDALHLTNELNERLDINTESSNFGLNSF